jgi:4-hydroxy-3-methylbut-2-enyl diphosphate reductase
LNLETIDATCPLVARVHASVRRHLARGYTILYIGGAGHDEVEGVIGEAPDRVILIESVDDARAISVPDPTRVAYCTETTFALDDVAAIVQVLRARFPNIVGPDAGDVCYAVQNRQEAVRHLVQRHAAEVVLVMGSANSANARRLCEVAMRAGAREAHLLGSAAELDPNWLRGAHRVGVSAGASAPERLVQDLLARLRELGASSVRTVEVRVENEHFATPPIADHRPTRQGEREWLLAGATA